MLMLSFHFGVRDVQDRAATEPIPFALTPRPRLLHVPPFPTASAPPVEPGGAVRACVRVWVYSVYDIHVVRARL